MNREEIIWAAGFFDGEGYVGCVRSSNHSPSLSPVKQTQALEALKKYSTWRSTRIPQKRGPKVDEIR